MAKLRYPRGKYHFSKRVASTRKTKKRQVYCEENGRYYISEAKMIASLADAKIKSKKRYLKGRKVRCLETGKWYTNIAIMKRSRAFSIVQKKRKDNTAHLNRIRKDSHNEKQRASQRKFYSDRPGKSMEFWNRGCGSLVVPPVTEKKVMQKALRTRKEFRNGKRVVRYMGVPREKAHGVQIDE